MHGSLSYIDITAIVLVFFYTLSVCLSSRVDVLVIRFKTSLAQ